MIRDIINDYIIGNRVVLTSSSNNGCTSFALYIANSILDNNKIVIYYNPNRDIDRFFVKEYYLRVYNSSIWIESPLDSFVAFMNSINYTYDCLIIDPGDILLIDKDIIKYLCSLRNKDACIIFTSQIRQDPNKGWKPYSTIERLGMFDYSIWITNVTDSNPIYTLKYVDIFKEIRSGSNFIAREIAKYTSKGNIVE